MKITTWLKRLFSRDSLRDKCISAYGEEFGELYDDMCRGIPIGGFIETAIAIEMIEAVKRGKPLKLKEENNND